MISGYIGFVAGMVHVLSGPDHLAAIAPLALEKRQGSWVTGFRWGLGHAAGVMVIGLFSVLLRDALPLDLISSWCERLVGVVLIGVGVWGIRRAFSNHLHTHEHMHQGERHIHVHVHSAGSRHAEPQAHTHSHAALAIGTLHGLAGSSHFWGGLPALAFPSNTQALFYLAAFGVGTISGMVAFSAIIGLAARGFAAKGAQAYRILLLISSGTATAVGGFWLFA